MEENSDTLDYPGLSSKDSPFAHDTSFVCNLKHFCPKLYFSLSSWEHDHLNTILFPYQSLGKDPASEKTFTAEPKVIVLDGDRFLSPVDVPPIGGDTTCLNSQPSTGDDSFIVLG